MRLISHIEGCTGDLPEQSLDYVLHGDHYRLEVGQHVNPSYLDRQALHADMGKMAQDIHQRDLQSKCFSEELTALR